MNNIDIGLAVIWYPIFLFSTTFHEAAHAYVAKRGGDLTAYEGGQVSLNPVPHVSREPFGMVLVPILSFVLAGWMIGWASTPFDRYWADRHPKRAALMSLAGPTANLILVLLAALAIHVGIAAGLFYAPERIGFTSVVGANSSGAEVLALVVSITFTLNLLLAVFNMIPLPPLDGSGVLGLFLSGRILARYNQLTAQPMMAFVGLIVVWNVFGYIFAPIHRFALNMLYPGSGFT